MSESSVSLHQPASRLVWPFPGKLRGVEAVELRPLVVSDAVEIAKAIEESLTELRQFMPFAHSPQTAETQRERIARCYRDYWLGEDHTFGLFAQPSGAFLGGFGLHARALNPKALEIGFWVRSSVHGVGLATSATRSLVVYGFEYLRLERIQCGHDRGNMASARVNDKCDFIVEVELQRFLPAGEPAWREQGWLGTGDMVLRRLLPAEAKATSWYGEVKSRLSVFDWRGSDVTASRNK